MKRDGTPGSSAFIASSHDGMMSTLRERVEPDDAARRWSGKSPLAGVWPVAVEDGDVLGVDGDGLEVASYADGGHPCACGGGDPTCAGAYPSDHSSVDLRPATRPRRERIAKQLSQRAALVGALFP